MKVSLPNPHQGRQSLTLAAHIIRNWTTKQFGAVNDLVASIRWCMTGTPIQNNVEDLGSLIKFLRVPCLSDSFSFRKHISATQRGNRRYPTPNIANLKRLLGSMCLRRNKSILSLRVTERTHDKIAFSDIEDLAYRGLRDAYEQSRSAAINGHQKRQTISATPLAGLLRRRMFCNIGLEACRKDDDDLSDFDQIIGILQQSGTATCVNCHADVLALDEPESPESGKPRLSHCYQLLCGECAMDLPEGESKKCPLCKKTCEGDVFLECNSPTSSTVQDSGTTLIKDRKTEWPSKLIVLVRDLEEYLESDKR